MKIFVANIPFHFSEKDVCDLFEIFGEITDCKLVKDPVTGESKGFGFIEFKDASRAKLAMKEMNGVRVAGRTIVVTLSTSETTKEPKKMNHGFKKTG